MKTRRYCFVLAIVVGILCISVRGGTELPESGTEMSLIGRSNPALEGITGLYVIVEPVGSGPSKDGLVWKELQEKIEGRLKEAGLEIVPGIHLGQGTRAYDVPELRVYLDMLKFADSQIYVFRTQVSFATAARLEKQALFFKAEVWQSGPVMQAVPMLEMPDKVTSVLLEQTDAFIHAWLAANPSNIRTHDANDTKVLLPPEQKQPAKPSARQTAAEYKYVASKNSKVFHKPDCSSAARIKPENLIGYGSRDDAINDGKRPCKQCNP